MNKCKLIFSFLMIIYFSFVHHFTVSAMTTGFETTDLIQDAQKQVWSNIQLYRISNQEKNEPISCFDVNKEGKIAIGFDLFEEGIIDIYDSNGQFSHEFRFKCSGVYCIEWDGPFLIIYFVRGSIALEIDMQGNLIDMKNIPKTINNSSYWNDISNTLVKSVDGNQYTIKNNMGLLNVFLPSYSLLIKANAVGETTVIYDTGNYYLIRVILIIFGAAVLISLASIVIFRLFKKNRNSLSANSLKQGAEFISKNEDWRLSRSQLDYLFQKKLIHQEYRQWSETWDHDHCEFCWEKFSPQDGDLHIGYSTADQRIWICENCCDDFKDMFQWEIIQPEK